KPALLPFQTQRFQVLAESNSAIVSGMRQLPPLKALRAFEAAARHLSFKAAADELSLTPTAISHQIRLLESVVGRDLFRRRPRPLTLTSVGAALLPTVRSSFDSIAEALASACKETTSRPPAPSATAASSLIGDPRDDEVKVTARLAARANPDAMSRSQP